MPTDQPCSEFSADTLPQCTNGEPALVQPMTEVYTTDRAQETMRTISLSGQNVTHGMVWYGVVDVCEGAPVAVSGWVLTDRHDPAPCAVNSLHRVTISVSNIIGGTGNSA